MFSAARKFINLTCAKTSSSTVPLAPILQNFQSRHYAARKRFYRKTNVLYSDGKYEITLDQRKLKTPKGNPFTVQSKPLALAVATEWDSQKTNIVQSDMHLSTLCNTVIDNPNNLTKYDLVQYLTSYLNTDTILFQSHEDDDLYKLQIQEWDPVIDWFCNRFQIDLKKCREMTPPVIDKLTQETMNRHFLSYNFESVQGYVFGVDTLKSVILTVACVERFLTPEKATVLSRLEEEFQVGKWGRVEWAHDLEQQELQARIAAAVLFVHWNSSSWLSRKKRQL